MGNLYIYCIEPEYVLPPDWQNSMKDFEEKGVHEILGNETMPHTREICVSKIKSARDAGTGIPWIPYNCTRPLIDGEMMDGAHFADCIDTATITYSGVNTPGVFKAKLHPNAYHPPEGYYISVFWSPSAEPSEGITGTLIFYGRVSERTNRTSYTEITAYDVLQQLVDKGQISVNNLNFEHAIYELAVDAGVYIYRTTNRIGDQGSADLHVWNKLYNSSMDGIKDILDMWYITKMYRQYIRADGGVIALCDYAAKGYLDDIDIIDASMLPPDEWEFGQSLESTYTAACITYPIWIMPGEPTHNITPEGTLPAENVTSTTNYHIGTVWNMRFRHAYGTTYSDSVTNLRQPGQDYASPEEITRNSLEMANKIANHVLYYHGYPSYRLELRQVEGISRLQPGMLFAVPYILEPNETSSGSTASAKYMALCIVRNITHTFQHGKHTMNLTAELDPYDQTNVKPIIWRDAPGADPNTNLLKEDLKKTVGWTENFVMISNDYTKDLPVRMPLWLRESIGGTDSSTQDTENQDLDRLKTRAGEMQKTITLRFSINGFSFKDVPYGHAGYVTDKYNIPIRDPDNEGKPIWIPHTSDASLLDNEEKGRDMYHNVCAALIRRPGGSDVPTACYLMYGKKGDTNFKAVAGIVTKMINDKTVQVVTASGSQPQTWSIGVGNAMIEVNKEVIYLENAFNTHMIVPYTR